MDGHRFDGFARGLAASTTRRAAVGGLVGSSLLATLGLSRAAPHTDAAPTCVLAFTATLRQGPSAGATLGSGVTRPGELRGDLHLPLGDNGAIDQGQLHLPDDTIIPVVGQAVGRGLHLRLSLSNQQTIVAVGTAAQNLISCAGAVDGVLIGPQGGDLGDWHAMATTLQQGGSVSSDAPPAAGNGATTAAAAGAPSTTTTASTAEPTAPSTSATADTMATTKASSGCSSGVFCGGTCCQGATGATPVCSAGACACQYSCASAGCSSGDATTFFTIACDQAPGLMCSNFGCGTGPVAPGPAPCATSGGSCANVKCCDGAPCGADGLCPPPPTGCGVACAPGLTACGCDCFDLQSHALHCGSCDTSCPLGAFCQNGACRS